MKLWLGVTRALRWTALTKFNITFTKKKNIVTRLTCFDRCLATNQMTSLQSAPKMDWHLAVQANPAKRTTSAAPPIRQTTFGSGYRIRTVVSLAGGTCGSPTVASWRWFLRSAGSGGFRSFFVI